MRTWLTEGFYAFAFFGALIPLFLAPWINLQYRRFGRFRGWPAVLSAAAVLYACSLVAFTMFPIPDTSAPGFCEDRALNSYWQVVPLRSLADVTAFASTHTLLETITSGVFLQVYFNVVFFVPLGFLIAYRWRKSIWAALVISAGVSLIIESTQGTAVWGLLNCPYRLADVDDLITNTLGGLIGWGVGRWSIRVLPSATPTPVPDLDPPSLGRRALAVALDVLTYVVVQLGILLAVGLMGRPIDPQGWLFSGLTFVVSLALFVIVPAFRKDRAGPGEASVALALVQVNDVAPAPFWSLLVRWSVRWFPVVIFGLPALVVILPLEALVAWRRRDGLSLSGLLSRTRYVTLGFQTLASETDNSGQAGTNSRIP